jgi:hypothetical protein
VGSISGLNTLIQWVFPFPLSSTCTGYLYYLQALLKLAGRLA